MFTTKNLQDFQWDTTKRYRRKESITKKNSSVLYVTRQPRFLIFYFISIPFCVSQNLISDVHDRIEYFTNVTPL